MSIISLEYMLKLKTNKKRYVHNLLHILNNPVKFQLNPISHKYIKNSVKKLFHIAVTLKYIQGH